MRVLLASDHYPPFIGGVQRQTRRLALELTARGHEVGVATVGQDELPLVERVDGFPVWRVGQLRTLPVIRGAPRRRHQPPFPDPVTAVALRRLLRGFRPQVVHSSGWFTYSVAAAMLGSPVPLLVSIREYGFICANASMLHKGVPCSGPALGKCVSCSRWYFGGARGLTAALGVFASKPLLRRRATAVHSVGRYIDERVAGEIYDRRRPDVPRVIIPSFASAPEGQPDAGLLAQLPSEPFILFVGALRRVKGVEILLAAYRELESPPALVLLGTPEQDTPIDLGPGVSALGATTHPTVLAAWDRSLFGVMPSLWPEPFGSVVHEAMSRGKAVIGTFPGGHADMIEDGRTGLLVPPADVTALAGAMRRLLEQPEFREQLGRRGAQRARDFGAESVVPQFERLFQRFAAPADPVYELRRT